MYYVYRLGNKIFIIKINILCNMFEILQYHFHIIFIFLIYLFTKLVCYLKTVNKLMFHTIF